MSLPPSSFGAGKLGDPIDEQAAQGVHGGEEQLTKGVKGKHVGQQEPREERGIAIGGLEVRRAPLPRMHSGTCEDIVVNVGVAHVEVAIVDIFAVQSHYDAESKGEDGKAMEGKGGETIGDEMGEMEKMGEKATDKGQVQSRRGERVLSGHAMSKR